MCLMLSQRSLKLSSFLFVLFSFFCSVAEISTALFLTFPFGILISCVLKLVIAPQFLNGLIFLNSFYFSWHFILGSFYCCIFRITDSFLNYVQSSDEPIKGILHSVTVLLISKISFCFLEFPLLCLDYPSVLTCYFH